MLRYIKHEMTKLIFQKKNYVVIAGHLFLLLLCYIGFKTSKLHFLERGLRRSSEFNIGDVMQYVDGFFFARAAMIPTFLIIFPIFICTIAGDIIAGEVQDGSLKLYASRSKSRFEIMFSKICAIFFFSLIYAAYFAIANFIIGMIFFGKPGTQLVYMHDLGIDTTLVIMSFKQALISYTYSIAYFSLAIMALGTITIMFSSIFNRMTSATVSGITVYFVCYIVGQLPFASEIRPYLLSSAINGTTIFWMERIPTGRLVDNLCLLGLYIAVFAGASLFTFNLKDIR